MARRNRRNRTVKAVPFQAFVRPTAQREAHNDTHDAGAARRVTPVIDTLLEAGKLTQARYNALSHYRDQAHRAEDDMAQESPLSPDRIMGGVQSGSSGSKVPVGILLATPAICEVAIIERDLGSLRGIARAIAVDDITLSKWCIACHGGRERYDAKGKLVAIVPNAEKRVTDQALLELRMAADRIAR